jgi:uncharacterized DUF497 family protein
VIIGRTGVEYDPDKEKVNKKKHGYSLESAVDILEKYVLPIPSPPLVTSDDIKIGDEIRQNHMTLDHEGEVVFMVTTMRLGEKVRVISFRRASRKERELYKNLLVEIVRQSERFFG